MKRYGALTLLVVGHVVLVVSGAEAPDTLTKW